MKKHVGNTLCVLCSQRPPIQNSHIVPKFVVRWIKNNAPSSELRSSLAHNKPEQDGWVGDYLCPGCEDLVGRAENALKQELFDRVVARAIGDHPYTSSTRIAVLTILYRHLCFTVDGLDAQNIPLDLLRTQLRESVLSEFDGRETAYSLYALPLHFMTKDRAPGYNQYVLAIDGYWFAYTVEETKFWIGSIKLPFVQFVFSEHPLEPLVPNLTERGKLEQLRLGSKGTFRIPSESAAIVELLAERWAERSHDMHESVAQMSVKQQHRLKQRIAAHASPEATIFHEAWEADRTLASLEVADA